MNYEMSPMQPFGLMLRPAGGAVDVRELPIAELREHVRRHRLLALRGFGAFAGAEDFADYCEGWGEVSLWPFGKVLELVEHEAPEDHIFDNKYVPLHWDGMYRKQVPEFQIFHCVSAPAAAQGGRTTFSDTAGALERAAPDLRSLWSRATGVYRRKMEFYDSKTIAPVVTAHPVRGFPVIRYNEPPAADAAGFVNRPDLEFVGVEPDELGEFHRSLHEALYAPQNLYAHAWQDGDVVVTDNYTLLHGREGFVSGAPRHLRRVHVLGDPPLDNPHLVAYE
ncbi:TauD/TfdA dioxygenase family protein [Lysobacter enzymogenes]|uniref:TauD/TfdA dioxygenase family protein n=1 Tax=Lysobacter enzymogenes TaxID=69 RepID=UPI00099CC874|nr:TauD/TfdA family dioxygenase [Lysobacter enzymogenes]UZW61130.1 TauD/TfdA family dioxygenase [Lysobacter enzymogenes]